MLKGVNRQMIVVKDVGNDIFEQAIFIVNPGKQTDGMTQDDMAFAAKEIVSNYIKNYGGSIKKQKSERHKSRRGKGIGKYLYLLCGAGAVIIAAIVSALVFL